MSFEISYTYEHAPTLRRFAESDKRLRLIIGPFGSGKSSACVMEILRRAQEQKSASDGIRYSRWAVIRNTYIQLNDTTIKTFFDWLPPKYFGVYNKTEHRYIIDKIPGCHVEILFRALDQEEHVSNLLSMELTGAWINEVREIPNYIFEALDGRIGRYPPARLGGVTWRGIMMDTNPPVEGSWLYNLVEVITPDNLSAFKQPSGLSSEAENLPFLDGGQNYYIELAKGKDQEYVDVYIHGKYGKSLLGKPVYTGFNSSLHVASERIVPIEKAEIILGMDFGVSEQAAVIAQLHPMGFFYVLDEVITENMGLRQFVENLLNPLLRTKYRTNPITGYGDPAGVRRSDIDETTCYEELKRIGVSLIPAHTNAPGSRIAAVDSLLNKLIMGKPAFQISPNCKTLIEGFRGGYRYKRIGTNYHPLPEKNSFSHCHDAMQYCALYIDQNDITHKKKVPMVFKRYRVPSRAGY